MTATWEQLLTELDCLRVEIRLKYGKELKTNIPLEHPLIIKLTEMSRLPESPAPLSPSERSSVSSENKKEVVVEGPFGWPPVWTATRIPEQEVIEVVERGEGEGRMKVFGRSTPFVPRKPQLEEVFDEKELGK